MKESDTKMKEFLILGPIVGPLAPVWPTKGLTQEIPGVENYSKSSTPPSEKFWQNDHHAVRMLCVAPHASGSVRNTQGGKKSEHKDNPVHLEIKKAENCVAHTINLVAFYRSLFSTNFSFPL